MIKDIARVVSSSLLMAVVLLFSSPCTAMDEEPKPLPTHITRKDQGKEQKEDFFPSSRCLRLLDDIYKKEGRLKNTNTYLVLSGAHSLLSCYYNSEDIFYRFIPLATKYVVPYLPEKIQPFFQIAVNEISHQLELLRLCQQTKKYIAEKAVGYFGLLLMNALPTDESYFLPYREEIEAAIYYLSKEAGWYGADGIQTTLKNLWEGLSLNSPEKHNRESFFVAAEASTGEINQEDLKECPISLSQNCQTPSVTCTEAESYTSIPKNVCTLLWPSLKKKWVNICINISNTNSDINKKPIIIFLGENHDNKISSPLLTANIVSFLQKIGRKDIKFFRESVTGYAKDTPYHKWLKTIGIPVIDADSLREPRDFQIKCGGLGGKREEGFIESIKENTRSIESSDQAYVGAFGASHTSCFAGNPWISQNFHPLYIQLERFSPTHALPVGNSCPESYHQAYQNFLERTPTLPTAILKIEQVSSEKERNLLLDLLIREEIPLPMITKKVAEQIKSNSFSKEQVALSSTRNWYRISLDSFLKEAKQSPLFPKKTLPLKGELEKKEKLFTSLFTLIIASRIKKQAPEAGGLTLENILKEIDNRPQSFLRILSPEERSTIQTLFIGGKVFDEE